MSAWFDDRYGRIASAIVWFLVAAAVLLWRAATGADTIDGLDDAPGRRRRPPRRLPELSLEQRLAMLDDLRDREVIGPEEYAARRQRILDDAASRSR